MGSVSWHIIPQGLFLCLCVYLCFCPSSSLSLCQSHMKCRVENKKNNKLTGVICTSSVFRNPIFFMWPKAMTLLTCDIQGRKKETSITKHSNVIYNEPLEIKMLHVTSNFRHHTRKNQNFELKRPTKQESIQSALCAIIPSHISSDKDGRIDIEYFEVGLLKKGKMTILNRYMKS